MTKFAIDQTIKECYLRLYIEHNITGLVQGVIPGLTEYVRVEERGIAIESNR